MLNTVGLLTTAVRTVWAHLDTIFFSINNIVSLGFTSTHSTDSSFHRRLVPVDAEGRLRALFDPMDLSVQILVSNPWGY